MNYAESIGKDAAFNVATLFEKLTKEKNQEERDKIYKRYTTLRHDIDMSLLEEGLCVTTGDSFTVRGDWEKVKKYFDKAYNTTNGEFEDADVYNIFFDNFRKESNRMYYGYPESEVRKFLNHGGAITGVRENFGPFHLEAHEDTVRAIIVAASKKRPVNVLMSEAEFYMGTTKRLKEELGEQVNFYGTYQTSIYNKSIMNLEARKVFERVAIGEPRSYVIKNRAMDICVHRFSHDNRAANGKECKLSSDLTRIHRYMKNGGLVIVYMPLFTLYSKTCMNVAKNYDYMGSVDSRVKFENDTGADMALMVFRSRENKTEDEVNATFRSLMDYSPANRTISDESIKAMISSMPDSSAVKVSLFSGSEADWGIVSLVFAESPLKGELKSEVKKDELRPLLPLKKGQVGQALVSGKLDGIIDEGEGYKHLIKGRVYRDTKNVTTTYDDDPSNVLIEDKAVTSSVIKITLIAGDGTIKDIAV